jgi:transaldolase
MTQTSYLQWLSQETPTAWWHDSADPDELAFGLAHGAVGVTTNPFLSNVALRSRPAYWAAKLGPLPAGLTVEARAELWMQAVVKHAAGELMPTYERTAGQQGYVCAQVNPVQAGNREAMLAMARRLAAWSPNIAVKLPGTAAGLDVVEECAAEGITITLTVSFTVPQVVATAERYRRGLARARAAGVKPGRCFSVMMIGRLDDYLREIALDARAGVSEADIRQAGLATVKRAYSIYQAQGYEATLLIAALRGVHHMTGLAGADLIMSIHPSVQAPLLQADVARTFGIDEPVGADVITRLRAMPEFVRSYEPDGMQPSDFMAFGLCQRTLTQFVESGWKLLETFQPPAG